MLTNAAVLLALAAPAPITAPPVEPPAEAVLDVLHFSGTGCPSDTTALNHSPDRHAATILYADYEVFAGPGSEPARASRNCTVILRITPPAGWTSAVGHIDQRGAATLPEGAEAQVRVSYQSANSSPVRADETLASPLDDGWQTAHRVPDAKQVYAPCGQPHFVVVSTEVQVSAPDGAHADASLYSTDFGTNNLAWKRC